MRPLPTGTITFVFTDIEGSTRLIQHLGDVGAEGILANHRRLMREAVEEAGGIVYQEQSESSLFVFQRPEDALLAAVAAQRALTAFAWPEGAALRVRMGLHSGDPVVSAGGYIGLDVHRAARICAAGHGGQILLSERTKQLLPSLPREISLLDLGSHRLKDLQLPEKLFQVVHEDLPSSFPPIRSFERPTTNLPVQLSSFVGRENELVQIKEALRSSRLVTLTGPGGIGKSRLALQIAWDLVEKFPDGIWLAELAPLRDQSLVPQVIATVLGVREQSGRTLTETLTDYLQSRETLLLMDNAEHLIAACAELLEKLLEASKGLRILVTSREPLHVAGEVIFSISPMSRPHRNRQTDVASLPKYDAVQLFVERATAAFPDFHVTDANVHQVVEVCDRLEGIPLAIELAASSLRVLSMGEIAARLEDRFSLVVSGRRTGLPRHKTMRATMDWGYELLSEEEQALVRRLSVFAGAFDLDAAGAVCAGGSMQLEAVFKLLCQLVDKSFVLVKRDNGATSYGMLETVRQYAYTRLMEMEESSEIRRRFWEWCLHLSEQAAQHVHGPNQLAWLGRLEREHDNLRAALELLQEASAAGEGLRLVEALSWFWYIKGHYTEGRAWLERALLLDPRVQSPLRARVLIWAWFLTWAQGDYGRSTRFVKDGLSLAEQSADQLCKARALLGLGVSAYQMGEHARAVELYEEALQLFRTGNDRWWTAITILWLGRVMLHVGNYRRASDLFEEGLTLSQSLGDLWTHAYYLYWFGLTAYREGRFDKTMELLEQSQIVFEELGDKAGLVYAQSMMGRVAHARCEFDVADRLYVRSLSLAEEVTDKRGTAYLLYLRGRLALDRGDNARAEAFSKRSLILRRELGDNRGIIACLDVISDIAKRRGRIMRAERLLGAIDALQAIPEEYASGVGNSAVVPKFRHPQAKKAWADGRRMTLEQAINYALGKTRSNTS